MDDDTFYRFYNDINGTLLGYSTEYSEYLDIGLSGERPDKSKDYGGKIPVIASYTSRYNIGDTIKYKCGKGITELLVVGKYTDNYLDSVILYNADTAKSVRLSTPMRIFSTIPDLPPLPKIKRTIPEKAWISVTINM